MASTGASSTVSYALKKKIIYGVGIKLAAFAVPFSVLGALISSGLNPDDFKLYFAILLISTSFYILIRKSIKADTANSDEKGKLASSVSLYVGSSAAGLISSLFGIGGGIFFCSTFVCSKEAINAAVSRNLSNSYTYNLSRRHLDSFSFISTRLCVRGDDSIRGGGRGADWSVYCSQNQ